MSKKINLDLTMRTIEGDPVIEKRIAKKDGVVVMEKGEEKVEEFPLTLKSMLILLVPVYPLKEKMVDLWDLGLKVKKGEGAVEFDNHEFSLIREVVEANSFPNPMPGGNDTIDRYFPFIIAQTLVYLDGISKEEGADEKSEDAGDEKEA